MLEAPSFHAVQDDASAVVEVFAAGVLDVETQPPHVTGSVDVLAAGVLLVLLPQTAQLSPSVLVCTDGLLEDVEDDHCPQLAEFVLELAAGVLDVAPSQFPHEVEFTEVATTGVGNPKGVLAVDEWARSVTTYTLVDRMRG